MTLLYCLVALLVLAALCVLICAIPDEQPPTNQPDQYARGLKHSDDQA